MVIIWILIQIIHATFSLIVKTWHLRPETLNLTILTGCGGAGRKIMITLLFLSLNINLRSKRSCRKDISFGICKSQTITSFNTLLKSLNFDFCISLYNWCCLVIYINVFSTMCGLIYLSAEAPIISLPITGVMQIMLYIYVVYFQTSKYMYSLRTLDEYCADRLREWRLWNHFPN